MDRRRWVEGGAFTATAAGRIWWRVDGAGPTLLFVHGFPTSSHDWAPVVAALAPRFRCVTFDLLGFGASAKPRVAYRYALQQAAVDAVVAASQTREAILIAHDYGATLGQLLVARAPTGCVLHGAIFLNGGIEPALHRPRWIQRFLASPLGVRVGPALFRRRSLERTMRQIVTRPERLPLDAMWESIEDGDGRAVLPRLLSYMAERRERRAELLAALTEARIPLGFVWGLADPISGEHMIAWVRRALPQAERCELPGIGHYPQLEAAEEVAAWIGDTAARWG